MKCRICNSKMNVPALDLFFSPPSNSLLTLDSLNKVEKTFPLRLFVCVDCSLGQLEEFEKHEEIFNEDYVYYSSLSVSWLKHCETYKNMIIDFLELNNSKSKILEIASNDGYLLNFFKNEGFEVLGVEPTAGTASVARNKGIETIVDFFTENNANKIKNERGEFDLVIGKNVLAHTPHIVDFVKGVKSILASDGTATFEIPYFVSLVKSNQFDTIYHEHFSYYTLHALIRLFNMASLDVYKVEKLKTHGGSLRVYICHKSKFEIDDSVLTMLRHENEIGVKNSDFYDVLTKNSFSIKMNVLSFLINCKSRGDKVMGYGAAAKGNTLLNYCGVKADLIHSIVDLAPSKQGKYTPMSHIPIVEESVLRIEKPDFIIILPWNIKDEIMNQLSYVREWGCKFVTFIPEKEIYE